MRRREFITLMAGAATASPLAARAQKSNAMRRVGVLVGLREDDPIGTQRLAGFRQGLSELGWIEGQNIQLEIRYASNAAQSASAVRELVTYHPPDVIVAHATANARAMQREGGTVPTVFVAVSDPIGEGLIANLARPGGRLTGLTLFEGSVMGRALSMLKEISPSLKRAAVIANAKLAFDFWARAAREVGPALGIEIVPGPVESDEDIERTVANFADERDGGLLLPPDFSLAARRELIISLAARYHLPAVYFDRFWVTSGGLMSYGVDFVALFKQSASYVDQILRGAKPADLPVQAPARFETVLNLKTAKMLRLEVPSSLLVRADEVIE
jgi:putative ABC transport system substrate-binding protein